MIDVWRVLLMLALFSPNATIGHMIYLHYFSFSVMKDKGHFMVLGVVEFKDFHT